MASIITASRGYMSHLWFVTIAIGLACALFIMAMPIQSTGWIIGISVGSLIGITLLTVAVLTIQGPSRPVWLAIAGFQWLNLTAGAVYSYLEMSAGGPPNIPNIADVFYVSGYLVAIYAMHRLARSVYPKTSSETWIDAVIITLAIGSAIIAFTAPGMWGDSTAGVGSTMVALIYPIMDLIILSALVRILMGHRRYTPSLVLIAVSFGIYLVTDIVYNANIVHASDTTSSSWLSAMYTLAMFLVAAGALAPGRARIADQQEEAGAEEVAYYRVPAGRLAGLMAGVFTPPTLLFYLSWINHSSTLIKVLATVSVAEVFLVLARVSLLLKTIQRQSVELSAHARTDSLTGLPNRRTLEHYIKRTQEDPSPNGVSVAMLDLDNFKECNDTYGHQYADRILVDATQAWSTTLGSRGFIARYGGEEFCVILTGFGIGESFQILEELRAATPGPQTVSIGYSQLLPGEAIQDALIRADRALYIAKHNGKDRVEFLDAVAQPV